MTSPTLDISADEFRVWLEARRGDIVGRSCASGACPFANWLIDQTGDAVSVGSTYAIIELSGTSKTVVMPEWARRFVAEVDEGDRGDDVDDNEIDGETALSILAGALRSTP